MKNAAWLYLLLFVYFLASCTSEDKRLTRAGQLIETAPDSALHILRQIPASKLRSDANRALYGLLMIESLDRKHLPLKSDSLLDFALYYYQNHPEGDRLAESCFYNNSSLIFMLNV